MLFINMEIMQKCIMR